jgi:hypothetical protein
MRAVGGTVGSREGLIHYLFAIWQRRGLCADWRLQQVVHTLRLRKHLEGESQRTDLETVEGHSDTCCVKCGDTEILFFQLEGNGKL